MQIGFYFDQTRCTGCGACQVACKDWNDIPAGPEKWMRIGYVEKGEYPKLFVAYCVETCYHCLKPVCLPACPSGAIQKREEDGIVVVDRQACLGKEACGAKCLKACPYKAPQFGPEAEAKMGKCDFCLERRLKGQAPVCVEACPTRALDAGPLEALCRRYGRQQTAAGFRFSERTQPAVFFKAKVAVE